MQCVICSVEIINSGSRDKIAACPTIRTALSKELFLLFGTTSIFLVRVKSVLFFRSTIVGKYSLEANAI